MHRGREHLIVALDLPHREYCLQLAFSLRDDIAMVKVGLEAFIAHGPDFVRTLVDHGVEVFLDLKLHDIPRTVAAAARQASRLGVRLLTIHAAGGAEMVKAAREAASPRTSIIAVTMLTSLDDAAAATIGMRGNVRESAATLGALARNSGADGLVCSAHELSELAPLGGVRVVPGIRPAGSDAGDQKRITTPQQALDLGATWLVVGRPILEARDPLQAARELGQSLGEKTA
jgi:orotidine-5'-phosphate decarboxylase